MPEEENSRFYTLTGRLWPETAGMDEARRQRALEVVVQLVYLLPFALAGLAWLALRTDYGLLADNLDRLLILFVTMTLLLLQPFDVGVRLGREGGELQISSSLAPLVLWSSLFISGAAGLWALVLAAVVTGIWRGLQLARYRVNPLWEPLSTFVQQMGAYVFATMAAAILYLEAGGQFPLTSPEAADWLPAFLAVVIGALLGGLLMVPVGLQIESLAGKPITLGSILRFYLGSTALPLIISPFSIIIALLNAEGRSTALIFILVGVWLVNRLAHHMSRANARSRRQAREFAVLEALGEALLEAPPDASMLDEVLSAHLPRLFPVDRVEVTLFETGQDLIPRPFRVSHPLSMAPVEEEIWDRLRRSEGFYLAIPDVRLPGERSVFGDALAVKIAVEGLQAGGQERLIGGAYLLRHRSVGRTAESLPALQSLASQVGSAVYRAEVYAETLAYQKTQQELAFAGRVQNSFLPSTIPDPVGWQIAPALEPARQTSGDFYDFIPLGEDLLGIVVADVSDKGTGAALYMALSRTLIRTYALESGLKPGVALGRANERIFTDTETNQFVTLIYGILNTASGVFTYANAGHNPGYLLRAGQGAAETMAVESLGKTGIPLGMFEGLEWKQASVTMDPGDVLLLYSDGVPEAEDADKKEYGDDRFLEVGKANANRPAAGIREAVLVDIRDFVGPAPQFDDITLVVIAREGKS